MLNVFWPPSESRCFRSRPVLIKPKDRPVARSRLRVVEKQHHKTLVLDLDETLIHSSGTQLKNVPHILEYEGGFVYKRPDVDRFLAAIRPMFDLFVFTASEQPYADAILDVLCPWIDARHRMYWPSVEEVDGKFRKNLTLFNRSLNKVMLIDDSRGVYSFFPENVLLVKPWRGEPEDNELMTFVMPVLEVCEKVTDVRSIIRKLVQR